MSLLDHIRELRYRIIVSFIAVVITSSVAFVFYRPLVEIVMHPYQQASLAIKAKNPTASLQVVNTGVVAPFVLNMSCLLYTSPSPRDRQKSRMPSSA